MTNAILVQEEIEMPFALKVMVPVAVEGDTVAVKITLCPKTLGFVEEETAVVVDALVTV